MQVRPGPCDSPAVMSFSAIGRRSVWMDSGSLGAGGAASAQTGRPGRAPVASAGEAAAAPLTEARALLCLGVRTSTPLSGSQR